MVLERQFCDVPNVALLVAAWDQFEISRWNRFEIVRIELMVAETKREGCAN